jgi:hypothetical protein
LNDRRQLFDAGFIADGIKSYINRKPAKQGLTESGQQPHRCCAHDDSAGPAQCLHSIELTQCPITSLSLMSRTTMTTKGGAKRPFKMADQNSIFTALSPE